jgi:quercetin dioxygenase-like cupin family protein
MDILNVPFCIAKWEEMPKTRHEGETGFALWRDFQMGNINVHMAEYSPGYKADGWCSTGHVLLVLKGQLKTELKDGRQFTLNAGESYQVSSSETNPHRSRTDTGATLFLVD